MRTLALRVSNRLFIAASLSASIALTGCGIGTPAGPVGTTLQSVSGHIHGGQTPIVGAIVTLYVAGSTGYGAGATVIGTGRSDSYSNFNISPSVTTTNCPAGSQAYITAAGGGANYQPANTAMLEMAALGDCSTLSTSTYTTINELTTVASAYALSGFTTTSYDSTNKVYKAVVGAPAANSSAIGSITATAPAGLAHAFMNAASLVDPVAGAAKSTISVASGGTSVTGTIPTLEINTLGDIMQACVDAGAVPNATCTKLFGFTPSISGVTPVNTLQALINLARNPYPSAAAMNATTGLLSLVSATSAFQPAITTQPPDWCVAIVYKGTPLVAPYNIALDSSDTVYMGTSATSANIVATSVYGLTPPAFTAATSGTATRQIAPDSLGNIWVGNNSTLLLQYSGSAGGAPTTYTYTGGDITGVAVDAANNVWVGNAITAAQVFELVPGTPYTVNYTSTPTGTFEPVQIFIDGKQNVWTADYYTNGSSANVMPNLNAGGTGAPTYTTTGTSITPIGATFASSAIKPLGVVVDASGYAWYGITGTTTASNSVTTTGVEEVIPTFTSSVITSITPQSLIANATLGAKASQLPGIDGAGTIYLPDNQGTGSLGIHVYSTVSVSSSGTSSQVLSPPSGYLGCVITGAATTCDTGSAASNAAVYNPRNVVIDSTGSVWAGITSGGLTQLIGLGAPTYPLLSAGKPGLSPGLTAVNPLP